MPLLKEATVRGLAFVPGEAFYTDGGGDNCMRLNFTNCETVQIAEGVQRLADLMA
ncbi:MAG: hypothetical protein RPU52_11110 [Candidatus Sedimenticola sp. (ex Thyasira tokunagai)]